MPYSYKTITTRLMTAVTIGLANGYTLQKIAERLRAIVNGCDYLNRNERANLFRAATDLARRARHSDDWERTVTVRNAFDRIYITARNVGASAASRLKRAEVARLLSSSGLFFICSVHAKPARGHKYLQGQIYVDYHWRQKVRGSLYYPVASYIRNHKIMTLQEVVRYPYLLTTRRYCKHRFIPLQTEDVLGSSIRKMRESIGVQRPKPHTVQDYYRDRAETYRQMNEYHKCGRFRRMIYRSRILGAKP